MTRHLVTGAAGLIGSHLVQALAATDDVVAVGRELVGAAGPHLQHLALDLASPSFCDGLPAQVDTVVHLAQSAHFRSFPDRALDVFEVNAASTVRLLDYARRAGARTFVLASSGGIYGHGDHEFSEEADVSSRGNLGFYLGSKLCAEILSESYAPYMNVIVLRFFFVYGPGQKPSMLVPRLIKSVQDGTPISLQGPDGIRINPIYVGDAVGAIQRALVLEGSHRINVGGPQALTMREIGHAIGRVVGKEPHFEVQADAEVRHLVGDIAKMTELLGAPQLAFEQGVARTIEAGAGLPT